MDLLMPDAGLLFWMTVIFLLLFFVLAKFGFPVITGMVDKRSKHIDESLAKAEEARLSLQKVTEDQARIVEEAAREQTRILKEAAGAGERIVEQAREEARAEAQKIMEAAKVQIEAEKQSALNEIRRQTALLGVEMAEKILRAKLSDDKSQEDLIERMMDEMDGIRAGKLS